MNANGLLYALGIVTGLLAGFFVFYPWGHRNGHLDGYQDHRDEVTDRKNRAELEQARAPAAESATPLAGIPHLSAAPGGGRPFPQSSPRPATTAADIGPVFMPATGATRIPMRPQPGRDSNPGTATMPRLRTTGEMLKSHDDTEEIIRQITEGIYPLG